MTLTEKFIGKLEGLKDGDRARLRQLAGQPLDASVAGFDLFTGLWWPLRQESPHAPERRSAWLVAKLYGASPLPHVREGPVLPWILGRAEPREDRARKRFRMRFEALLQSRLAQLELHLSWALQVARKRIGQGLERGLDWVQLLEELRKWDREKQVREKWAEQYFQSTRKGT